MHVVNLNSIEIKNFRTISELEVDLSCGITLIKGKNGSGKSSIPNAIYTCIYNRQLNGRPASAGIKNGTKSSLLKLNFTIDNVDKYSIIRTIGKKSSVELLKNGDVISKGSKVKSIIEELIPQDIIKLNMLQSLDIKSLISGYVDVSGFVKKVSDKRKEYEMTLRDLEHKLQNVDISINNFDLNISEMEKMKHNNENDLNLIMSEITSLKQNLNSSIDPTLAKEKHENIIKLNSEYTVLVNDLEKNIRSELNEKVETPIQQITSEMNSIASEYTNEIKTLDLQLKSEIDKLSSEKQMIYNRIKNLEDEISKYTTLINQHVCFVCEHEIDEKDLKKYEAKISQLQNEIKNEQNKIAKIENDTEQSIKDKYKKVKIDKYNASTKRIEELNNDLKKYKSERELYINKLNNLESEKQKIYTNLLKKYNITTDDLKVDYSKVINNFDRITELSAKINIINKNIQDIVNKINQYLSEKEKFISENKKSDIENKIKEIGKKITILKTWENSRLLNKLITKKLSSTINSIIKTKYNYIIQVNFDIDDKDNLVITAKNMHGDIVPIEDASTGEGVIGKLILYSAFRTFMSQECSVSTVFLDEFLDSLDDENVFKAFEFLKDIANDENISIFIISHRQDIQTEAAENVIDMNTI